MLESKAFILLTWKYNSNLEQKASLSEVTGLGDQCEKNQLKTF